RLAAARAMLLRRLAQRGVAVTAAALTAALGQHAAASVPPAMMAAALEAAAGVITGNAAVLAEGVLKTMLLNKLKIVTAGGVTAGSLLMITLGLAGVLMVAAQSDKPASRTEEAVAKEFKALQGEWKVVGMESDGKKAPVDYLKEARWTFKGQQLEITHPKEKA